MLYLVIGAIFFVLLVSAAYAGLSGAPWVPTWKRDLKRAEKLLNIQEGEVFYELGCGDGRFCLSLAKTTKGDIRGIELSLAQYLVATGRKFFERSRATFTFGDVFKKDLSDADAIYLFLMPETYDRIAPKLRSEVKPGTRIVSYVWPIPGWEAVKIDALEGAPNLHYYTR